MYIPGHLSVAYLITSRHRTPWSYRVWLATICAPCMLGSLTPDLIDKPLHWFGGVIYGRSIGHALVCWLAISIVVALLQRHQPQPLRRALTWWLLGVWSHLAIDTINDVLAGVLYTRYLFSGWWAWPWRSPDDWEWRIARTWLSPCTRCWTPLEGFVIGFSAVLALWHFWAGRLRTRGRDQSH